MHLLPEDKTAKIPSLTEKFIELESFLNQLVEQERLNENEASYIGSVLREQSTVIDILKEDNFQMKKKLPQLQPIHDEFLSYKQDASDTILKLTVKLNDMQLKVLDLEKKLTQFGIDVAIIESSKAKELDDMNNQWEEKFRNTDNQSKKIIDEIVKNHCEVKKGYENVILGLKEQIAHKEAEVAWCQLMLKERDSSIDKEIGSLKKELEVTTMKNQELLQQRLQEVERRANKMTRKCLKLQHDYEHKISNLKKEKDLQVQALQKFINKEAEKEFNTSENKVESAVKELEMRYRKIIISLHTATQQQRNKDMKRLTTLESAVAFHEMVEDDRDISKMR